MRRYGILNFLLSVVLMIALLACSEDPGNNQKKTGKSDSTKVDTASGKKGPGEMETKKSDEELIPVEVTTLKRGQISKYLLLSSNLETEIMADVYARMQGIVKSIRKEEGQYVKKNDVLLELEPEQYELAEQKAEVEYKKQLNNYNRLKAMHEKSLLSDEEFEAAKFAKETAQIQWDEAKLNLDYMKIRAPINGRVGDRLAKIGQRIQPTDKLFSVVDNSEMIAVVYVPEKNINILQLNQKAEIVSEHLPQAKYSGWVKRISPVVDPGSGTFKVTVGVHNKENNLRPGMFVNVRIIIDTHNDVLLIPKTAIVYENEYMNVYVVRDSLAHKIRLEAGYQDYEKVEALKDLEEGEKIIIVGQAGMKDKTRVKIVNERNNKL